MWCGGLAVVVAVGNPNLPAAESQIPQIWTHHIPMTTGAS
jgi:hypothetical protein